MLNLKGKEQRGGAGVPCTGAWRRLPGEAVPKKKSRLFFVDGIAYLCVRLGLVSGNGAEDGQTGTI